MTASEIPLPYGSVAVLHEMKVNPQRFWYDEDRDGTYDGDTGLRVSRLVSALQGAGFAAKVGEFWQVTTAGRGRPYRSDYATGRETPKPRKKPERGGVDPNAASIARACEAQVPRVRWALDVLGDEVPDGYLAAARLRLAHPRASLSELAVLSGGLLTRDAIGGRLSRLVKRAEAAAREQDIEGSEAA